MAVTTWTFPVDFEGWTFTDASTAAGAATRTYVTGAIRNTLILDNGGVNTAVGQNNSPTLNAAIANLDTIDLDYGASTSGIVNNRITAFYTDLTSETTSITNAGAATLTLTLTQSKILDHIQIQFLISASGSGQGRSPDRDILEVRLTTATPFTGTGQRALEFDIELEGGNQHYVTYWDGDLGGDLMLRRYDREFVIQNTFTVADDTATLFNVNARLFYLSPYCPPFFGTASLDAIVYIYGRWDDGSINHLAKSINGGSSFSDIGDSGTWGSGWVGAFFADDANTLFAFVNGDSRALYRSINAGSSWTNLSSLPFDVDPGGVSKHPDGRILIINRETGPAMAAYAVGPDYSSWIDATGAPSFPTGGGGANAVVWIT